MHERQGMGGSPGSDVPQSRAVLDVALVGTGGMMPLPDRWLASVLLRWNGHMALFDCGEGTQISLRALGWGLKAIDIILVSHVHGDHIGGLPGLLLSQGNAGRTEPVDVFGPPGLSRVVAGLRTIAPYLPFEVRCHELTSHERIDAYGAQLSWAAGDHAVACLAYRLELPRQPGFRADRARALGVPREEWKTLQRGQAVRVGSARVTPGQVLGPPRRGICVGLVVDTRPTPAIERLVRRVDLLVCEGMYTSDEELERAVERKHMTFSEAAGLARRAHARSLVLTHFSPSVTAPEEHLEVARAVFPESVVGRDHMTFRLAFPEEQEPSGVA